MKSEHRFIECFEATLPSSDKNKIIKFSQQNRHIKTPQKQLFPPNDRSKHTSHLEILKKKVFYTNSFMQFNSLFSPSNDESIRHCLTFDLCKCFTKELKC